MELKLRRPLLSDESAFFEAYDQTKITDPNFAHFYSPDMRYSDWLQKLERMHKGVDLSTNEVQSIYFLAFVKSKVVGRVSFRYELNDFLAKAGGHIGYVTVPAYRRLGYASEMLRQSLVHAKSHRLTKVLLTCDQGNIASQKTIEKCGGILENIIKLPELSAPKMRFWILKHKLHLDHLFSTQ